jgi:hypothetical protein
MKRKLRDEAGEELFKRAPEHVQRLREQAKREQRLRERREWKEKYGRPAN